MIQWMLRVFTTAVFLVTPAFAQKDYSDVEIKTTHVAGSVYMLEGSGGNIGISAGSDGVLMIDDQFAGLSDKIQAAIDNLKKGKLKFVLNTHWHADHTGGNSNFGKDALIVAHTNVRQRLSTVQKLFTRTYEPLPKEGLPVVTFDDSISIHFNGEEIQVLHYPNGHTDGDSVVYFPTSKVIHMGDILFAGSFPFVDLDHGGDVEGLIKNIKEIIKELPKDVKVIPGHGSLSTLDDLKAFHKMLVGTTDFVRMQMREGKSVDDIKKAGFPKEWEPWDGEIFSADRWIDTIHTSLTRKK